MPGPEELLGKMPKNTPVWAVGIVTVLVALCVSFIGLYLTAKNEIATITNARAKQMGDASLLENTVTSAILQLAQDNSSHITQLSGALFNTQKENSELSQRVSNIEKDLALAQGRAIACEEKLAKCK